MACYILLLTFHVMDIADYRAPDMRKTRVVAAMNVPVNRHSRSHNKMDVDVIFHWHAPNVAAVPLRTHQGHSQPKGLSLTHSSDHGLTPRCVSTRLQLLPTACRHNLLARVDRRIDNLHGFTFYRSGSGDAHLQVRCVLLEPIHIVRWPSVTWTTRRFVSGLHHGRWHVWRQNAAATGEYYLHF